MVGTEYTAPTQAGAAPALAATDEPPISRIGRYRVLGLLGRGGMGEVYLGLDEQLQREVAIKLLARSREPERVADRLKREALALACLAHSNVVVVHEVGEAGGQVYLVMERVRGVTLRTWLAEGRREIAEVLAVMTQAGRGLAAAHAAGLVHRDFKPDNVMIDATGRVRVMDFGLACAANGVDGDVLRTMPSGRHALLDGATSSGHGTPGYMAPEQYVGVAPDLRCDIFGFCVVLFEALHGQRPFQADSARMLREAILRGRIVATPRGEVPRWLDAVIHRGLLGDPELRWPSMAELLAALAHRPVPLRRRALRVAGALALLAGLGLGVSVGTAALERVNAAARTEALANERLVAAEAILGDAEARGEAALADATFQTFVGDPAHRGTRALALAWEHQGDRRRRAARGDEALDAYARAYLEVREPAAAAGLMRTMAELFRARWDGPALALALANLRAHGLDRPEDAGLALEAALLQGDLSAAAAWTAAAATSDGWARLLGTLAAARPTGIGATRVVALPAGGPAAFVAGDTGGQALLLLDAGLAPVRRVQAGGRQIGVVPGAAWAHVFADGAAEILDLGAGERSLWRGPAETAIFHAHALDLDGDRAPELLLGRRWPALGFRVLTGLGGPVVHERVAHAGTDATGSELSALWAGDLDGDGTQEIVAAMGPWGAFDLRVFHGEADGTLALRARRRLGRVTAMTGLRRGPERLLAVINDEHCPSPELFPAAPHTGEPAGVHLLRWDGVALLESDFLPLPRREGAAIQSGPVAIAADLDGDAAEELVFELVPPGVTLLVRVGPAGLDARRVHGLRPLIAAQLDDDAAQELVVRAGDDAAVWVLGVGEAPLPALAEAPVSSRPVPPSLRDPLLVERWIRADELAAVGLPAPAAASLREVVVLTTDPDARRDLREHAAELLVRAGDDAGVVELSRDGEATPGPEVLSREAAALARLGRYPEAHAAALAVLDHPDRRAVQAEAATQLRARLDPLVRPGAHLELDFRGPLDPAWNLLRPASLRREGGALRVTLAADPAPVAELPLVWDGGPLALEFELDVERLEYGACLRVGVVDRDDRMWLGAGVCGLAGGGRLLQIDRCTLGGSGTIEFAERAVASAATPRHVVVRLAAFADGGAECSVDDGTRVQHGRERASVMPLPGPLRLVLGSFTDLVEPTLAIGSVARVTIHGARAAPPGEPPGPRAEAARSLVEGEGYAVLAALDQLVVDEPRDALLRVLATAELRDPGGLAIAVQGLLPRLDDPAWRADLALLVRTRPAAAMALLQAAGPRLLPVLGAAWGPLAAHLADPEIQRSALAELVGVEQLSPTTDEELHALRRLLCLRGRLREQIGDGEHARADLEAGLALRGAPESVGPGAAADREVQVEAHLRLAGLLVALDPGLARAHAEAAVALSPRPELVRDRLGGIPGLR